MTLNYFRLGRYGRNFLFFWVSVAQGGRLIILLGRAESWSCYSNCDYFFVYFFGNGNIFKLRLGWTLLCVYLMTYLEKHWFWISWAYSIRRGDDGYRLIKVSILIKLVFVNRLSWFNLKLKKIFQILIIWCRYGLKRNILCLNISAGEF